ncbi:hypothetical protein BX666DRAFT_1972918 [Dichotomocladium elegans]|nr:hypothetical protein BX666DRAFT_1972918 [Dichotomocladium elegans]
MPSANSMQSITGIITQIHNTTGQVPPPLVGASVSVIGNRVFVFAGRLVASRQMTNYLYVLDLRSLEWTRHIPPPDSAKPPRPRYFHSANVYKNSIIVFGGMGYSRVSNDKLNVLDDVAVFDIETMSWIRPSVEPSLFAPRPRYAHLATVTDGRLVIMGGQNMENVYLEEINVLDLSTWEWVHARSFESHVGTYRSVAVTGPPAGARTPGPPGGNNADALTAGNSGSVDPAPPVPVGTNTTGTGASEPSPIYLYSNYNFADVHRELHIIHSPLNSAASSEDCTSYLTGSAMPPGLRFPTGHTLGHHLVVCGTYLSSSVQSFTIWALDLGTLAWSRIETGPVFGQGSWNYGMLYAEKNCCLVFGHRDRNLIEDYNHRQVNFNHVALVDLEAFGVYKLPEQTCSALAQEMGLSLLNEPTVSDFRIHTSDGKTIPVNSAVLSQRWQYFAQLMQTNRQQQPQPNDDDDDNDKNSSGSGSGSGGGGGSSSNNSISSSNTSINDDHTITGTTLKTHSMSIPYSYPVVIALLQFLYTDNLLTAQQYQPHILAQLLLLSDMYSLVRLRELTTHALHQMLNMTTAPLIYETAALSHQTSLQVRALKMMIAAKKLMQQQQQQQQPQQQQQQQQQQSRVGAKTSGDGYSDILSNFRDQQQQRLLHFQQTPATPALSQYTIGRSSSVSSQLLDRGLPTSPPLSSSSSTGPGYSLMSQQSSNASSMSFVHPFNNIDPFKHPQGTTKASAHDNPVGSQGSAGSENSDTGSTSGKPNSSKKKEKRPLFSSKFSKKT